MLRVVKLGGSLIDPPSPDAEWLQAALEERLSLQNPRTSDALLVVPGGGHTADRVRERQQALGLDDVTAHEMAVVAMQMNARMLRAVLAQLVREAPGAAAVLAVQTPADAQVLRQRGGIGVWLPEGMALAPEVGAGEFAADWTVTSDTLALWLAARVGADALELHKACRVDGLRRRDAAWLAQQGIVDAAFAPMLSRLGQRAPDWTVTGARLAPRRTSV